MRSGRGTAPPSRDGRARGFVLLALAAALVPAGCMDPDAPFRAVAEEENLTRQVEDLRTLVARAEKGALVPRDGLVVSVSEDVVRKLLQLALPREDVLQERFHVRLEKADVHFDDGHGTVRLEGRVAWRDATFGLRRDVSADLTVLGRVEAVAADPREGTLTARVVPYGFEIHRLRVGEERPRTRRLMAMLGRALPEALSALSTRLTLPVAFERELRLRGAETGAVRIPGASVPLRVVVRSASAHGRRLWVGLGLETGSWKREKE